VTQQSVVQINPAAKRGLFANLPEKRFQVYQIHLGITQALEENISPGTSVFLLDETRLDGWLTADGWCAGGYCHGLFENDDLRHAVLQALIQRRATQESIPIQTSFNRQSAYDALAETLRQALDLQQLKMLCQL
jgi:adenosylcobyric acid synthase